MVASAGHKLGQIIGDWWEHNVVLPILSEVATELNLFLDNRFVQRSCRGSKINWPDSDGNEVDYDYVLELGGSAHSKGVPVAFVESFWRRGARHSKDKARDDTNKLLPMRFAYPTARFLAIAACGEFTEPAREYVRSRDVELFYISKTNIVKAFSGLGLNIDYEDDLVEEKKLLLVNALEAQLTNSVKVAAFDKLRSIVGLSSFQGFQKKIVSSLSAMPQEIKLYLLTHTGPLVFSTTAEVSTFLASDVNFSSLKGSKTEYVYTVLYTDGSEFSVTASNLPELKKLHSQVEALQRHMGSLAK